jgi:pilus assembly protein FimV
MKLLLLASAAALFATAATAAPPAKKGAPAAKPAAAEAPLPPDTSGVTDEEVQKAALIAQANAKLGEAVDTAPDKTKAQAMLGNQQRALFKSVGLSVDRYNEIAKMGPTNPSLAARIVKANPDAASVASTVEAAQTAANAPAPQASAAPAAPPPPTGPAASALAANQNGVPASGTTVDPKTSPTDPSLTNPVAPPGVNDLK